MSIETVEYLQLLWGYTINACDLPLTQGYTRVVVGRLKLVDNLGITVCA